MRGFPAATSLGRLQCEEETRPMAAEAEKAALEAAAAAITMNTTRGATTTTTMPSRVGVFNCFPALWHSLPLRL